MHHSAFTDASCTHQTHCFSVYCITAITYNCCYNNSPNSVLFRTSKNFPISSPYADFCMIILIEEIQQQKENNISISSTQDEHFSRSRLVKFCLVASSNLKDVWIKQHCYTHKGATSSAGAGNRRSVSLEYLEYPLWKIKVFLGVKKDTVFSQRSVGETLCCLCSKTLLRCSTPSEHLLSRLPILPLREKHIFTWETKKSSLDCQINIEQLWLKNCIWKTYIFCRSLMMKGWFVVVCVQEWCAFISGFWSYLYTAFSNLMRCKFSHF